MGKTEQRSVAVTRLSAKGQLTLPVEYRRALALSADTALVIVPQDEALEAVTRRRAAWMQSAGSDVEDLIAVAAEARGEIGREAFRLTAEE